MVDATLQFDGELKLPPPPASLADLGGAPSRRGVYVLFAADGRPVAALAAAGIRRALAGRLRAVELEPSRRRADLSAVSDTVRWRLAHSRFETDLVHLEVVRALWPRDFSAHLPRRRAWFIHFADIEGLPRLEVVASPRADGVSRCYGPFASRKAADRFVELLTDVFDLCRYNSILRQAPHGRPCTYAQMGRCAAPCGGAMPMADYRDLVRLAWRFACGDRQPWLDDLSAAMKAHAARAAFEQAAVLKKRLDNAAALADSPAFAHADDARRLRFVSVQRGPRPGVVRLFALAGGTLRHNEDLNWPCPPQDWAEFFERLVGSFSPQNAKCATPSDDAVAAADDSAAAGDPAIAELDPHALAIVVQYLYATADHAGVVLPAAGLNAEALAAAIEASAAWLTRRGTGEDADEVEDDQGGDGAVADDEIDPAESAALVADRADECPDAQPNNIDDLIEKAGGEGGGAA